MKQESIAQKLGISRASLSKIENGEQVISVAMLMSYCELLGSSVQEIVGRYSVIVKKDLCFFHALLLCAVRDRDKLLFGREVRRVWF